MKYIKIGVTIFTAVVLVLLTVSCSQEEPNDSPFVKPSDTNDSSTTLIYAVATNSLSANLVADKNEMLKAAESIDLNKNSILVFQAVYEYDENYHQTGKGISSLLKLVRDGEKYKWQTIKEYTDETAPLNPNRITEVIQYTKEKYPAKSFGMVFWSHSTASDPYFPTKSEGKEEDLPSFYSFGQDVTISSGKPFYQLNVDDLASAIPTNLLDFIWFDSCYMSNIESIYQLRNKCRYFIGYPTEVLDDGMPYQYTLPLLASASPDIIGAANRLYEYYENESRYQIATIAVVDMDKIDVLMEYCKEIYKGNETTPSYSLMHKYTNNRQSSGPFYDLGDYTKAVAEANDYVIDDVDWNSVLSEVVVYKAATAFDFNGKRIDPERYSGISTYVYNLNATSDKEKFYESLDWFRTVYSSDEEIEE